MGWIGKILDFFRDSFDGENVSIAVCDKGGGYNVSAQHFAPLGDDSVPLANDLVCLVETVGEGNANAVGYIDIVNSPIAASGEKRIYARQSDGDVSAEIWLKNDRTIVVRNAAGQIEMGANGEINLNGVIIDVNGNLSAPTVSAGTSLKVGVTEMLAHVHGGVASGGATTAPVV